MTEGTAVHGSIATKDDRDVFTLHVSSSNTRVIVRKGFGAAVDVYDYAENVVASGSQDGDRTVTLAFESTPGSAYYIVVKSSFRGFRPLNELYHGEYELTVRPE
jgi:hypothetical protein